MRSRMLKSHSAIFLLIIYSALFELCDLLTSDYLVTVTLFNGSRIDKNGDTVAAFPDVESEFKVSGLDVMELKIERSHIKRIYASDLKSLKNLQSFEFINNNFLRKINPHTFKWNPNLSYVNLERNAIDHIASNAFTGLFQKTGIYGELDLSSNNLLQLPMFSDKAPGLSVLRVNDNPIRSLRPDYFENVTNIEQLFLRKTKLKEIPGGIFQEMSSLHRLHLSDNEDLKRLDENTFAGANKLLELHLDNTAISYIPHKGLNSLQKLFLHSTPNLWDISDGIVELPKLLNVRVSSGQRYLCCAFEMKRNMFGTTLNEGSTNENLCPSSVMPTSFTKAERSTTPPRETISTTEDVFGGFGKRRKRRDFFDDGFLPATTTTLNFTGVIRRLRTKKISKLGIEENFLTKSIKHSEGAVICNPITSGHIHRNTLKPVICTPEPDELRPCDDIMGNVLLTVLSWIVSIVALIGNSTVFVVLILSRRSVTVTKFLLINLSFADLCLALYLFILVSASGHTSGKYYHYVRLWQYGGGCGIAGFLAIFSSQLSMLVLVVITVERYFAIVYAMHFHRRMTMKHARIAISICWCISTFMALLPLAGLNSYDQVALCLPFKVSATGDLAYVGILLMLNVTFFIFVVIAYIRMYCVVRSPHLDSGPQRNDSEVAKRMALLVFTDFLCWGPIAFVGMVSAFGSSGLLDIDVKKSKYLLVIFFPINALCNPFLYAVSTNSFKRDLFDLLTRCGLCHDSITKANEGIYSNSVSHKHSMRNSEAYHSQVSRLSSAGNNDKTKLLTKLLIQRHKMSSRQETLTTPESNYEEERISAAMVDEVFFSDPTKLSPVLRRPNGTSSPSEATDPLLLNNKEGMMETIFSNNNDIDRDKKHSGDDLVIQTENSCPSSNSDLQKKQKRFGKRTSGFSQYDLSPEAFRKAKETSTL